MARRIACPLEAYPDAWIELPDEWRGAHLLRRDEAIRASAAHGSDQITIAVIALAIADGWGGIAGLEGHDPARWDLTQTPIALLRWLELAVYEDFLQAFIVPKNSSAPSPTGSTAAARETMNTAGNSGIVRFLLLSALRRL